MNPGNCRDIMEDEEIEDDFQDLLRICDRLQTAVLVQDERRAYCFAEAARCLAGAVVDVGCFPQLNGFTPLIEGAMQNGLWGRAADEARQFADAVEAACIATSLRLSVGAQHARAVAHVKGGNP